MKLFSRQSRKKKSKRKRTFKVTLTVVNDIRWCSGSLTSLVPKWRLAAIIEDAIVEWRDLKVKKIKVKKA